MDPQAPIPWTRRLACAGAAMMLALALAACQRDERAADRSGGGIGEAIKKVRKASSGSFERAAERTRQVAPPRR